MSDTVLTHMDTIISLCREHRAELLFVATPSPLNYNYERHNSLAAYAEEHQRSFVESSAKKYMEGEQRKEIYGRNGCSVKNLTLEKDDE